MDARRVRQGSRGSFPRRLKISALLVLACLLLQSCRSSEESKEGFETRAAGPTVGGVEFVTLDVAPQLDFVSTVQLYRAPDETSLPVLPLRSAQQLRLEFDLMIRDSRPLRIEFVRADRRWRDDFLTPTRYMGGPTGDSIREYRESTAPASAYVHYEYSFPNEIIQFKLSGNYVLTVLDPTLDNPVLFERPFVVTEESVDAAFELRAVPIPGAGGVWNQPYVLFDPTTHPSRDLFDYGACFIKNVRFDLGRCTSRPSLFEAPFASFDLEPQASFEPEPDLHLVDVSEIRAGISIENVFFDVEPYQVKLVPDQADMGSPEPTFQNGQSAVRQYVRDVSYPQYESEYVMTEFTYIPFKEQRANGPVMVIGSFNGWVLDERNTLTWIEEERRYRGAVLLKQGRHPYQYFISGGRRPSTGAFAPVSSYSALLYYYDPIEHTDRLVSVRTVLAP